MSDRRAYFRWLKSLKTRKKTAYDAKDSILISRETSNNDLGTRDYYMKVDDLANQIATVVPAPTGVIETETYEYSLSDISFAGPSGGPLILLRDPGQPHVILSVTMEITTQPPGGGFLTGTWDVHLGWGNYATAPLYKVPSTAGENINFFSTGADGFIKTFNRLGTESANSYYDQGATNNFVLYTTADPGISGDISNAVLTFRTTYHIYP